MVYVMFLSKDWILIRFELSWDFFTQRDSGYLNEGKFLLKERALVRFGLSWNFWPKVVRVAPIKGKKYKSNWTDLGAMENLAFG